MKYMNEKTCLLLLEKINIEEYREKMAKIFLLKFIRRNLFQEGKGMKKKKGKNILDNRPNFLSLNYWILVKTRIEQKIICNNKRVSLLIFVILKISK